MKVCSICNEIVASGEGCSRSNCPNQNSSEQVSTNNIGPGATGVADKIVQTSLDNAAAAARSTTRGVAIIFAVIFIILCLFLLNPFKDWDIKNKFGSSNSLNLNQAIATVYPQGLSYTYYSNSQNSGCNGNTAKAKIKKLVSLDNEHYALISLVSFDYEDVPHVCYGLIKVDVISSSNNNSILRSDEITTNGFGQVPNDLNILIDGSSYPKIELTGEDVHFGYVSKWKKHYEVSLEKTDEVYSEVSCHAPDGTVSAGAC